MLKETSGGDYINVELHQIEYEFSRTELVHYLESRGFACYDDESTESLRAAAKEDLLEG